MELFIIYFGFGFICGMFFGLLFWAFYVMYVERNNFELELLGENDYEKGN